MPKNIHINKGLIRDNTVKAPVKSNLFRPKIQQPKKGKGAYSRKGRQPSGFLIPSKNLIFLWG